MRKTLKYGLLISAIVVIAIAGFMGFGFYTMEIEDHYGDLRELYYNSKNGDIIVNKETSEFGIIEKNWNRVNIKTLKEDSTDLYSWIYRNGTETKIEIYRSKVGIKLNQVKYTELLELIDSSELKLIIKN